MRRSIAPLAIALALLGIAGTVYRSLSIGYPLFPRITERIWAARLAVEWEGPQAWVDVLLPREGIRQSILDERISSGSLEATVASDPGGQRRLRWRGEGASTASYEADISVRLLQAAPAPAPDRSPWLRTDELPGPVVAAARRVTASLPPGTAARRCFELMANPAASPLGLAEDLGRLRTGAGSLSEALVVCWRSAGLPARVVQVLPLRPGIYSRLEIFPEVFEHGRWAAADLAGRRFPVSTQDLLIWTAGERSLVETAKGGPVKWQIELRRRPLTLWTEFFRQTADRSSLLARWSLYSLPPNVQEVFRILLLVPIGALVVAALRNVVGFATFGTFMPILIAIAFRQTGLTYGLLLFTLLVGVGYAVRLSIDRYKLLLVPRLSVILTFVIGCLALLSLVAHRLGFQNVAGVGLLPMVIMTMTIERFFVVAEESGAHAALTMAASTGAVASITYVLISWEYLQLLFFTYPELLLVVVAGQLALGRYVGFRLTELWRFRRLTEGT